jgi:hypothetical protein
MTAMTLVDGYQRTLKTRRTVAEFRPMTNADALALVWGEFDFCAVDGTARRCRVSGETKRWKRDRERFRIPCKYGMYENTALINGPDGLAAFEGGDVATPAVRVSDWRDELKA